MRVQVKSLDQDDRNAQNGISIFNLFITQDNLFPVPDPPGNSHTDLTGACDDHNFFFYRIALLLAFKCSGNLLQQFPDGQVLGTNLFALPAANAFRGFPMVFPRDDIIVVIRGIPVMESFMGVHG